ncbi:MAG: endonuclease/exonuclease/phosphatase family protein [Planctomycetaceae bacterium]|nr:endonuclease/exonuclease/phosphatase family protein [Planctomycetaceae bacterium]
MPRLFARAVALVLFTMLAHAAMAAEPVELKVISFNVLVDFSRQEGVPKWADRKDLCIQVLREQNADLVGLQEPSPGQVKFFLAELPGYEAVHYKGYTDATLLYKRELFDELERGWWFLSPTPERVSTGFGNALPRVVVWAKLRHKPSGRELLVFNTHFDNSMPSQVKMAELCQQKFAEFTPQMLPMIFVGDFNTDQKRGDYAKLVSNGWQDAYRASPRATPDGRDENVPTHQQGTRIDHIFYHGACRALAWERLESPDPQRLLSDHYAIAARLALE